MHSFVAHIICTYKNACCWLLRARFVFFLNRFHIAAKFRSIGVMSKSKNTRSGKGGVTQENVEEIVVEKGKSKAKSRKRKEYVDSGMCSGEEEVEPAFDGARTFREGDLRKEKEKVGMLCAVCSDKIKNLVEEAIAAQADEIEGLKRKHSEELNSLRSIIAGYTSRDEADVREKEREVEKLESGWSFALSADVVVKGRLDGLNGIHSTEQTDQSIPYVVNNVLLGVCLHCFASGRLPRSCLFLKGKTSVGLHRNSNKCAKPGVPNRNDPQKKDKRMIQGKDYLELR